jgi:hypothetical protein
MDSEFAEFMDRLTQMAFGLVDEAHGRYRYDWSIPGHREAVRPRLIVIHKNRDNQPTAWVYGPYMIIGNAKGDIASAGIMSGFDLWEQVPQEIDHLPVDVLLQKIDTVIADVRGKGWKPPEYLEKKIRKPTT